jgi:cytochrome P450
MCIGEGFARVEALIILASVGRRWRLRLEQSTAADPGISLRSDKPLRMIPVRRPAETLVPARAADLSAAFTREKQ